MEENKPIPEKKDSVFKDVGKQVVDDIILPQMAQSANNMASSTVYTLGDAIVNLITAGICKLFKQAPAPITKGGAASNNREKYANVSRQQATPNIGTRSSEDLQYVCVESFQKAEQVKKDLIDAISKYGRVRVADLYESSGKVKSAFTDFNYGWTNVNDVHYVRDRNGYWFNMPKPQKLNN